MLRAPLVRGWRRSLGGLGVLLAASVAAGAEGPTAVVERLNQALRETLEQADGLGYAGRAARLAGPVSAAYDVPFMAEKSLGSRWKDLNETQRQRWIELSREFSVANYAANFDHFAGQRFELLGEEPAPGGTTIVRTHIVEPGAESVEMSYRLHQTDTGWRIIDVYLKGTVSELAMRRADYASVLERQGFDALVDTMRARIADLAAGRGKGKST